MAVQRLKEWCRSARVPDGAWLSTLLSARASPRRFRPHPVRGAAWISGYAGASSAAATLDEIERTIISLADTPHRGSLREEIAPGLNKVHAVKTIDHVEEELGGTVDRLGYGIGCRHASAQHLRGGIGNRAGGMRREMDDSGEGRALDFR